MTSERKRKKMEPAVKNIRQESVPDLESHSKVIYSTIQQARQSFQRNLREQVRELRQDMENITQTGKDPLCLFPQEIWAMIFRELKDVDDLANCARASSLFEAIINSSRQELLFGKVIPFVLPYMKMDQDDIYFVDKSLLLCRQICRTWRSGVDNFANSFFRAPQPNLGPVERLKREQQKYFDKSLDASLRSFCLPIENPVDEDDSSDEEEEFIDYLLKVMQAPFLVDVYYQVSKDKSSLSVLETCSHRVGRLSLRRKPDARMSPKQFYELSVAAINMCPNLQTFCLISFAELRQSSINKQLELRVPKNLECLQIFEDQNSVLPVQDELVRCFSPNLKFIMLVLWNCQLYPTLSWSNLTALEILRGASAKVLKSLGNMVATNLQKLSLELTWKCRDLKVLFKAINQFPNLRHLSLILSDGYDVLKEKDIVNVPVKLLTVNSITILELISKRLNTSRILPVLFPAVRNLTLRYGNLAFDKSCTDFGSTQAQPNQPEFIQVYRNMYKSNIWIILPQLDSLSLEFENYEKTRGRVNQINNKKTFTRRGYILGTEEYFVAYQRHLGKVWDILRYELNRKLEVERKELSANARSQSTSKVGVNLIFPYVLCWLGKSDALNCRLLGKSFQKIVDDQYSQTIKPDMLDKFHLPLDTNSRCSKFHAFIERNSSKPFFAYNTEILLKSCSTVGITMMLNDIGKSVEHLTISVNPGVVPGIANIYDIVRECMKQCVNMKSFSLNIHYISHDGFDEYLAMKRTQKLMKPKNFEKLSTYGPKPNCSPITRPEHDLALNILFNDLELMCGKTLKIRKQENAITEKYSELQELTITNLGKKQQLSRAPALKKLHLCLTMKELGLEYIWEITRKYPKLELLELQFASEYFRFTRNIIYQNLDHIIRVTTLKIVVQDKWQISLDFLAHFPCVKILQITYGKQAPLINAENISEYVTTPGNILDTEADIPYQELHPRQPEQDFIQLAKYFRGKKNLDHDKEKIYASNVWVVLRKLQKLEIVFWPDNETEIVNEFYRKVK